MALEPRFMFDGAAVGEAAKTLALADTDSGLLHFSAGAENTTAALSAAQQQAIEQMLDEAVHTPEPTPEACATPSSGPGFATPAASSPSERGA